MLYGTVRPPGHGGGLPARSAPAIPGAGGIGQARNFPARRTLLVRAGGSGRIGMHGMTRLLSAAVLASALALAACGGVSTTGTTTTTGSGGSGSSNSTGTSAGGGAGASGGAGGGAGGAGSNR